MKTYIEMAKSENDTKVVNLLKEGRFSWCMKHSRWESIYMDAHSIANKISKIVNVKYWYKKQKKDPKQLSFVQRIKLAITK